MNRRNFTIAGFFGTLGAAIGKALGYDGTLQSPPALPTPERYKPKVSFGYISDHTMKVGRKIMRLSPEGAWEVYADTAETAARSNEAADVHEALDRAHWADWNKIATHHLEAPPPRERLSLPPPEFKRWHEAPAAVVPSSNESAFATLADLKNLREELEHLHQKPEDILRSTIFNLWRRIDRVIANRESFCEGHHGPAMGPITDAPDGRRLCAYCLKQEQDHGRDPVTS